ncbi:MAG TPA: hypothetical protein VN752_11390, partial [Solirubrobacterales bacterium]|nr:hypothetical protein [Solirubrobacterales bacterium]
MRAQAKRSSVANRVGSPLRGFAVGNRDDRTRGHFLCAKGSGTLVLHRGGGLAISLLAAALAVLVLAPNAAAFLTREKTASIGSDGTSATSFGDPNKLAFNLANGKLYVLDGVGAKIHAFDVPALTPLGGAFPLTVAQTGGDPGLAVDNTALASANNIYYLSEPNGLYGFDSTGASLSGFPVARSNFGDPCGAATDSAGGIWISDFAVQKIRKYDATGSPTGTVDTSTLGGPCPVAVASNGDLFFALFQGATWKYTVASGYSPASAIEIDPAATRALAVDTAADVLYVVHSDRVDAYNASTGAPLYDFAGGIASAAFRGVAVDQGTNEVYVSDTGNGKVHVFGPPASFPDATATAIAASNISYFSADVEGTVDDNDTSPTNWRLEVSADGFATVILAAAGRTDGGQTGVGVSGTASGLSLNTNYEFRVVTNKTSSPANDVASAPVSFKTLNHPNATATPTAVTNVTEESAEIGATITDNGPLPTNWRLELSSDGGQTWTMEGSGATSGGQTDVAVSTTASDLAPNTSYRFRVVTNKGPGSPDIVSSSTEFKTSSVPPVVTDVGAIQVTDTSARLVGTIDPRNSATAYAFEYGTTPALDSSTAPVAIGGGTAPITVSQVVSGLSPDTTYYFKLVATNEYGTTASSSKTLHTRAVPLPISHPGNCANEAIRQAQGSTFLPDCRAYEMVSPPDKNQG